MPFTHRELDAMQVEAQRKIEKLYVEWRMSFEASRLLAELMQEQGMPMGRNALIPTEEEEIKPDGIRNAGGTPKQNTPVGEPPEIY